MGNGIGVRPCYPRRRLSVSMSLNSFFASQHSATPELLQLLNSFPLRPFRFWRLVICMR
jgi:hypothetical protein